MRAVRFAVFLVALFILGSMVSIPKAAAVCGSGTWNGNAGDGKWETAGNWSGNCVPNDFATIPNDAFVVTISTPQTLDTGGGGISIGTGDTLICASGCTLTITATNLAGGVFNSGTFVNFGTVDIISTSFASGGFFNSGTVINRGTITVTLGSSTSGGFFNSAGTFDNFGILVVTVGEPGSSGGFFNDATFNNYGTVNIPGPDFNFFNDGYFNNICGGTVSEDPTSGKPIVTKPCVVGGEILYLDYGSLLLSAVPWVLIIVTLATAAAIIFRQKFKLLL